ncbi:MAG: DUF1343 domain-containing protein [Saprospiraceae bacterium]
MSKYLLILYFLQGMISLFACSVENQQKNPAELEKSFQDSIILPGAFQTEQYFPLLKGKNIGLIINHTSTLGKTHLVDTLLKSGFAIQKIFGPEHGWKGEAADGELVEDSSDKNRQIEVISLYGKNKKPSSESLEGIDLLVFDIQDVGTRFYTYISTLQYIMESAAENNLPVLVLDRPNPNGHFVDGPVLKKGYESFVGLQAIPAVYGMTIGEYALMLNGESWLDNGVKCDLTVIKCKNYDHNSYYELPVKPSPNLPNMRSVLLYPSLCFVEGTVMSEGRGTDYPFQLFGHPDLKYYSFTFVPEPNDGAPHPKLEGKQCFGKTFIDLRPEEIFEWKEIKLDYLVDAFQQFSGEKEDFFRKDQYMDKLYGSDELRDLIKEGKTAADIKKTWEKDIQAFLPLRKKYLLYPDFD